MIEVSVTSHDYDRSKLSAYANAGVNECWFVLGPEKKIETYRQPKDGRFTESGVHGPGGTDNLHRMTRPAPQDVMRVRIGFDPQPLVKDELGRRWGRLRLWVGPDPAEVRRRSGAESVSAASA